MAGRLVLQLVSTALVGAAIGGGLTYQVLVSNTVKCLVEAPKTVEVPPPPKQPFLDMTNGKRF